MLKIKHSKIIWYKDTLTWYLYAEDGGKLSCLFFCLSTIFLLGMKLCIIVGTLIWNTQQCQIWAQMFRAAFIWCHADMRSAKCPSQTKAAVSLWEAAWVYAPDTPQLYSNSLHGWFWVNFWSLHIQKPCTIDNSLKIPGVVIRPYSG